jgi:multidrug efflux pump subunit AcrA (membrane-fusion protein)
MQPSAWRPAGIDAILGVPEIPDREFPGKVTRIADALQPGTRTLLTEMDIPNPDGALTPGIYCTVELRIPRKTPSLGPGRCDCLQPQTRAGGGGR